MSVPDTDHSELAPESEGHQEIVPPPAQEPPPSQLDRIESMLNRAHVRFDEIDTWRKELDDWREKVDGRLGDGDHRFGRIEQNVSIAMNALVDLLWRIGMPGESDRIKALVAENKPLERESEPAPPG